MRLIDHDEIDRECYTNVGKMNGDGQTSVPEAAVLGGKLGVAGGDFLYDAGQAGATAMLNVPGKEFHGFPCVIQTRVRGRAISQPGSQLLEFTEGTRTRLPHRRPAGVHCLRRRENRINTGNTNIEPTSSQVAGSGTAPTKPLSKIRTPLPFFFT